MIANLQKKLNENNLDAMLITSMVGRRYMSGFTGSDGVLLITKHEAVLYVDGRYTIQAKNQAKYCTVIEAMENPFNLIKKFNFNNLGFEDKYMVFDRFSSLHKILPTVELVPASDLINSLRVIKSKDEQMSIKNASKIADKAFLHILNFISLGKTEREIAIELDFYMQKHGAEGTSFPTIIAFGDHSALPHAKPSDRELKNGDIILMDYGCIYNGYCSDMTRTVAIGNITDEQKNIYNIVLNAQICALNEIKSDILCSNIDEIARDIITNNGYANNFSHSLGHSVGLEIHEEPRLSAKSLQILKTGMTVTVEPGIYVEHLCGVRIEDLVCVTQNGCENFTSSPKELIIL